MLYSKTFWTSVTGIVGLGAKMVGVEVPNEVFGIIAGLGAIFLRHGIMKGE